MANEIKIGNLTISNFKVGSGDCTIYLGNTLLYPTTQSYKWIATYTGGTTSSAACDASSAITQNEIELTDLESVVIDNCVTNIGTNAFDGCSSLTSVTIPDSVTSIGTQAFQDCSGLTSITIPDSVTNIGDWAFYTCSGLTSCTIGSGVTSIGYSAFQWCSSLTSITIPSAVTSIGEKAFYTCSSLTSITVNATTPPALDSKVFDRTNNCPILVPSQSLNAYKAASRWSNYADRIQPIQ